MFRLVNLLLFCFLLFDNESFGFFLAPLHPKLIGYHENGSLMSSKKQSDTYEVGTEETPAGIVGAEFFGGNKQKEELYVQSEEEAAAVKTDVYFNRFFSDPSTPSPMFDSLLSSKIAHSLQSQINSILYENADAANTDYGFASDLIWESPMKKGRSPLDALDDALAFYNNVDLAIVSGSQIDDLMFEFQWELSVVWPTFWAPRVHLVGTSVCQLNADNNIVKQTDKLMDDADLLNVVSSQIKPRFWDWYHFGMTPSAECTQKLSFQKKWGYQVYEIPPRLVTSPSMVEVGTREDGNAESVPDHAFSCYIKTVGPKRQRYVPTTPVEVQIMPEGDGKLQFKWIIPMATEFMTNSNLPLAGTDKETNMSCDPRCKYEFHQRRKVATIYYGGYPQDAEVADVRKKLYEKVVKDGFKPKLDQNGRPLFFFLQNDVKACYTSEGLGMCVYEWRSKATKPDEIGIELELA